MPVRITEWDIPASTSAFESIELVGFDVETWYGINAAGATQTLKLPIAETLWEMDPNTYSLTGQNLSRKRNHKLKELRFKLAISIKDPSSPNPRDRVMGPMSDIFTIAPVMGIFAEGNHYYKWRIKI